MHYSKGMAVVCRDIPKENMMTGMHVSEAAVKEGRDHSIQYVKKMLKYIICKKKKRMTQVCRKIEFRPGFVVKLCYRMMSKSLIGTDIKD